MNPSNRTSDSSSSSTTSALDFSGLWIPLITPFRDGDGSIDTERLGALVKHYAAQGVSGFVACGSTGEAAMCSEGEHELILATVIGAARKASPQRQLPVIMGLSGVDAVKVGERAAHLAEHHAPDAFLVTAPHYVKPSQAGLIRHFLSIAEASPRPIVVYDIPARTGVRIETSTLLELAAHPRIVAVKDCSADRAAAEAIVADGRLALLAGNDDELFDQLARGAVGSITASAHLATASFVHLHALMRAHILGEARALWRRLLPLVRACFAEPNPAPVKAALAQAGLIGPGLRAPMVEVSVDTLDMLTCVAFSQSKDIRFVRCRATCSKQDRQDED